MEIDEPSNQSDMSIDLTDEVKPFVKNIDKGAGVLDCPEYVLEIDSYLRKCEVYFYLFTSRLYMKLIVVLLFLQTFMQLFRAATDNSHTCICLLISNCVANSTDCRKNTNREQTT